MSLVGARAMFKESNKFQSLLRHFLSLRFCAVTVEEEPVALEALKREDLMWRIRKAQDNDKALVAARDKEYWISDGFGRDAHVPKPILREILQQEHHSRFSIHLVNTNVHGSKMLLSLAWYEKDFVTFVLQCQTSQIVKVEHHVPSGCF